MEEISAFERVIVQLYKPDNRFCADCQRPNPRWASTFHGIFICKQCADIHKSLYKKQKSQIKSIGKSKWKDEDAVKLEYLGNKKVNKYYESNLNPKERPDPNNIEGLTDFIKNKYEYKWSNSKELPPTKLQEQINNSLKPLGDKISLFFTKIILIISLIIMLILKYKKIDKFTKTLSFELIILIEFLCIKYNFFEYKLWLVLELFYCLVGFGIKKGLIVLVCAKLIRYGMNLKNEKYILFFISAILVFIGFGLENLIITVFSGFLLYFILYIFHQEVTDGKIKFFE